MEETDAEQYLELAKNALALSKHFLEMAKLKTEMDKNNLALAKQIAFQMESMEKSREIESLIKNVLGVQTIGG